MYRGQLSGTHAVFQMHAIVEILFPKETLRARALEIIIVHKIEVSEGVSIFIEKRKINILLPHRIRMVRYPPKFNLLE